MENRIKCKNCNFEFDSATYPNYCPNCGYGYNISPFEKESIQRRMLAEHSKDDFSSFVNDAGPREKPKDWMLKREYITASLENNNLFQFLVEHFGKDAALRVAAKYRLETHNYKAYSGAAIFYQYDKDEKCHAFKVMQYDKETGKRIKISSDNEGDNEDPKEEHALLYQKPLMGTGNYCLFGRHLLAEQEKDRMICVVESEKTALIASIAYPNAIWLATGSCYYLTKKKIDFPTNNLYLFPDPDIKEERNGSWYRMAKDCAWLKGARVSHFMENYCKANKKATDFDIADYIIENYNTDMINNDLANLNDLIM